tara:strand:+ start:134 stop:295 length:162 start_codon:yes stop_codon:yes gene_type:complete
MATSAGLLLLGREALEKAAVATGRERRAKAEVETSEDRRSSGRSVVRAARMRS